MSLQSIREQRGMTRRELAQRSGVNFRSIQDYEQGHKRLSSAGGETLLRLASALGCQIEELLWEATDAESSELLPQNDIAYFTESGSRVIAMAGIVNHSALDHHKEAVVTFVQEGDSGADDLRKREVAFLAINGIRQIISVLCALIIGFLHKNHSLCVVLYFLRFFIAMCNLITGLFGISV